MAQTIKRPIQRFATTVSRCSAEVHLGPYFELFAFRRVAALSNRPRQAATYGKCIVADYNAVEKDKCAKEFIKLKDCCLVRLRVLPGPTFMLFRSAKTQCAVAPLQRLASRK